jgi:tetratricopeptide (TPR) repeat protein
MGLMEQARYYYEKALYSEAERIYLQLESTMPDNYDINFRLGNIYVRTGQFPAAEARYLKCIDIDSSEPKCWYNLSLLKVKEALAVAQEGRYKSKQTDKAYSERFLALQEGLIESITGK